MSDLIFAEADRNLTYAEQGDVTVVMTPNGAVHRFNALQVKVLKMLDGKTDLAEIAKQCSEEFETEISAADLRDFLRSAEELELLSLWSPVTTGVPTPKPVVKRAKQLADKILSKRLLPPYIDGPMAEFGHRLLERLKAGDPRGAAGAQRAMLEIDPSAEWVKKLGVEIEALRVDKAHIDFSFGRITIPLGDPDAILKVMDRYWGWFFSPWGVMLWIAVVGAGLIWGPPINLPDWRVFLNPGIWAIFYSLDVIQIAAHEFSHALTCRHYGGKVNQMGVGWLFFGPMAYADVTASYLFPKLWQRELVMFAGCLGQVFVVSLMAIAWSAFAPNSATAGAISVIVFASWFGVVFNWLPFRRTDGYFIVADFLGVENLSDASTKVIKAMFGRWVAGDAIEWPEETDAIRPQLLVYGVLSILFSAFVLLVLIPQSYARSQGSASERIFLWLTIVSIFVSVFLPALKGIPRIFNFLRKYRRTAFSRRKLLHWALPSGIALLALLFVRLPEVSPAEFVLQPAKMAEIHASTEGEVREIRIRDGETVHAGEVLAVLRNDAVELELTQAQIDLRLAQIALDRLRNGPRVEETRVAQTDLSVSNSRLAMANAALAREEQLKKAALVSVDSLVDAQDRVAEQAGAERIASAELRLASASSRTEDVKVAEAKVREAQAHLDAVKARHANLELRSPMDGVVLDGDLQLRVGQWLQRGDMLMTVSDTSRYIARLSPGWLADPQGTDGKRVRLMLPTGARLVGAVQKVQLQSTTVGANRAVTLETAPLDVSSRVVVGMTGDAKIEGSRCPLWAGWIWHPLERLVLTKLWVAT